MTKTPTRTTVPEGKRDPALGIDAGGGPAALPQNRDVFPHAEDDDRGEEAASEDWLADPAESEVYQLIRSEVPSEGFLVVAVPRPADRSLPDGHDVGGEIFATEEDAQAEADRRNNALNVSTSIEQGSQAKRGDVL